MVRRLTPGEMEEAVLTVMPCFEKEFGHFAPVKPEFLAAHWKLIMDMGGLAFGLEVADEWRGFLLGSVLPDMVSGVKQGLEFFWLVEKEFRGEASLQLLNAFEAECKKRGAQWVVIGMSQLAAPEKRKRKYAKLGYVPHCETWYKKI
jgi:hypothetical protein